MNFNKVGVMFMNKEVKEAMLDTFSEQIKRLELTKANSQQIIEDCDRLINEINESIKDLKADCD